MGDNSKKISLLNHLDDILSNNCVNTDVYDYEFHRVNELIINYVNINAYGAVVRVILHLDDFIVEIYRNDIKVESYSVPYIFIENFHILLEE